MRKRALRKRAGEGECKREGERERGRGLERERGTVWGERERARGIREDGGREGEAKKGLRKVYLNNKF